MKFVMTQSICPEGIKKLKADTNGQVEIIAEDNPDPNNYLDLGLVCHQFPITFLQWL